MSSSKVNSRGVKSRLIFQTEGVLVNEYITDTDLSKKYACIIVDKAHERSENTDLLIAFLRLAANQFPTLKITLAADQFPAYFPECKVVDIPGNPQDVAEVYTSGPPAGKDLVKTVINLVMAMHYHYEVCYLLSI
jgi:HrpA-like RNA helicase